MTDTTPDYAGLSRRLGALAYHIQQTGTADGQDAQTCLEVADALRTLLESNAALERERDQLRDKLHCMCGSPIDHSAWEGHTPVSVYDYSLDQERSRAERAEAALAEARKALRMMLKEHDILSGNFGDVMDPKHKRPDRWPTAAEAARRALGRKA